MRLSLLIGSVNKDIKSKINSADNHFHNILRLFDVLPKSSFITSERCAIFTYKVKLLP